MPIKEDEGLHSSSQIWAGKQAVRMLWRDVITEMNPTEYPMSLAISRGVS